MGESVAAESLEILDMNYWQPDGTLGTMLEPASERGEALACLCVSARRLTTSPTPVDPHADI